VSDDRRPASADFFRIEGKLKMKRWITLVASALFSVAAIAQPDGGTLKPENDPANNAEIIELLTKAKKRGAIESLPKLSLASKAKVMKYFKAAKAQTPDNRTLAGGLSGAINGYSEIENIRAYLDGDRSGTLPMPYTQFKTALEFNPFPGAEAMLGKELELSKQLEDALVAVFKRETAENRRETAEIRKQTEIIKAILKAMDEGDTTRSRNR
jgi:hypothetical protein